MDAETLNHMTRVYMSDRGCSAAVERLSREKGISLEEAALEVAKTVAPAPHNFEAHNARYLLAPEVELADEQLSESDSWAREAATDLGGQDEHLSIDDLELGPVPPTADEAIDDRRPVSVSVEMTSSEWQECIEKTRSEIRRDEHQHTRMCELESRFYHEANDAERIPVEVPMLRIHEHSRGVRVTMHAKCIPARGRDFLLQISLGSKEETEKELANLLELLEHEQYLSYRLVVRTSKRYTMYIAYRPDRQRLEDADGNFVEATPEQAQMMQDLLASMFGLDSDNSRVIATSSGVLMISADAPTDLVELLISSAPTVENGD